jgi:hypothetical protein
LPHKLVASSASSTSSTSSRAETITPSTAATCSGVYRGDSSRLDSNCLRIGSRGETLLLPEIPNESIDLWLEFCGFVGSSNIVARSRVLGFLRVELGVGGRWGS